MPKLLNINSYSLNIKVTFTLFVLASFLLTVLFLLIVPKMQEEQYNFAKKQIEQMIAVTKEQVILAGKAISMQSSLEESETKYKILTSVLKIKNSIETSDNLNKFKIQEILQNPTLSKKCNIKLITYNERTKFNNWKNIKLKNDKLNFNKKESLYSINTKLSFRNFALNTICESSLFNENHSIFEEDLKSNIQRSFALTSKIHKGKSYLIWINKKYQNEDKPLFTKDEILRKDKYTISNMSNVQGIYTSTLSPKQIISSSDKEALSHILDNKEALTWVNTLYESKKHYFLLITTAYKKDFDNNIDSAFWKILPASLIALFLAIIAGFFLFKRLFKGINILTNTAKEVNQGNKKIRSKVKGNDDIGNLGTAFDSMLNSFENNIKTLDSKVDEKTKELKNSLEEKEILLKEIHHRVKNNLALTISLIKLQQSKIKDKNTKEILNNIQERIYTMELLHRKLYESTNLNSIPFKEYVSNLVLDISNTYEYEKEVEIQIDMDDIHLNIERAMPCGLILNEIITNSFKYAFVDNKNPKLCIIMKKDEENYTLTIKDNGKGIDKRINIYNTNSLGLKLINSISKLQLLGKLNYSFDNGAVFKINF